MKFNKNLLAIEINDYYNVIGQYNENNINYSNNCWYSSITVLSIEKIDDTLGEKRIVAYYRIW